ncbi:MAG: hypothetical protein Q9180_006350 [Flavoplaca navasiana]
MELAIELNFPNHFFLWNGESRSARQGHIVCHDVGGHRSQFEWWPDFIKRAGNKKFEKVGILRRYRPVPECTESEYPKVEDDLPGGPTTIESIIAQIYEDMKINIMSQGFSHHDYSLREKTNARAMKAADSGDVFLRDWNDAEDDDTSAQPIFSGEGTRENSDVVLLMPEETSLV